MSDNPYPDGDGMKLNMGRNTMNYELHTAWDEGYAEGFAAGRAAATPRCDACDEPFDGQCAACRAEDDARHPQDEFDGAGCCPEEDGFLRAKARAAATSDQPEPCEKCRVWSSHCPRRAAATPDPRVPSGLPIGYGGPTIKTDPLVLLAQVKAVVDERLDEREGCGPWRRDQFMRIDALLRDVARAASPDERLREAGEAMAASIRELGRPIDDTTGGRWVRSKEALDAWVAALNAGETP